MKKTIFPMLFLAVCACQNTGKKTEKEILPTPEATVSDTFMTDNGKKLVLTPIHHGSLMFEFEGKIIQVDPVTDTIAAANYILYPKADYILITHEHYDHLDAPTLNNVIKQTSYLLAPEIALEKARLIPSVSEIRSKAISNGQSDTLCQDIIIEAVPAYNTTADHQKFHPQGVGNGYIMNVDGLRIYIAGDTEDIQEMNSIKDIDVAFLPCNQPYTMLPQQMAKAAAMIQPKIIYPYHFSDTDTTLMKDALKDSGSQVRIRQLQ